MTRKTTTARAARKPTKPTKKERSRLFSCAICEKSSRGVGNDAWPTVRGGICCDKCHEEYGPVVLPLENCLEAWGMSWAIKILAGVA